MRDSCPVRAHDIWFAYRGEDWVLKGVSLEVPRGTFMAIMGPSGAGKSTLLRLLAGLLRPQRGSVQVLGHAAHNGRLPRPRARVGYIPQQLGLVRNVSALENVLMGALGRVRGLAPYLGLFPREEVARAMSLLEDLGIGHKARDKAFQLSGGERQRVAIARALMQQPEIVLADEFVSDLDLPRASEVLSTMRELGQAQGVTFVVNMHELPLVHDYADLVTVLRDGEVTFRGPARAVTWAELQEAPA
ncbi:Lipoprotein-releasing system ATP-binding protein LolD [bacterium HR24]|jgi:phosphonate transport system ATP-binding protein|nr:Lipoprotein-releasing system ATP-binding protein LolD [bacterium HR24]